MWAINSFVFPGLMTVIGLFLFGAIVWLRHLLKNKVKYGGINTKQVILHVSLIVLTITSSIALSTKEGVERHFTAWTIYHTCTFLNNITIAVIFILFNISRQKSLNQIDLDKLDSESVRHTLNDSGLTGSVNTEDS